MRKDLWQMKVNLLGFYKNLALFCLFSVFSRAVRSAIPIIITLEMVVLISENLCY